MDIVFHGQRVKRRRRGYAVAATGAGTAALVVVAFGFGVSGVLPEVSVVSGGTAGTVVHGVDGGV
ncbi:hypothetical protein, partial [Saccharothrix longispora]|uniref:hypothetical protein n=1 Tax=Saccharothrix longispora TaxID=33920 RepID=UPI0028FD38B4